MIRRTNTASGAYLLRRAAHLAKSVVPKFGKRREVIDGYIVEGARSGERRTATVLDLPGTLTSFGVAGENGIHTNYGSPTRDFFDPRQAEQEVDGPLMTDGYPPQSQYFILGNPPPSNHSLYVEGTPWEGDAGVYHAVLTRDATVGTATRPYWLMVRYQPAGVGDGRRGAVISHEVLKDLAPGYDVVTRESLSYTPQTLPIPHGREVGDEVVLAIQMIQVRTSPSGAKDAINAVLMLWLNLKTGEIGRSYLYQFDAAAHPLFELSVMSWTTTSGTTDAWPETSASLLRFSTQAGPIQLAFMARTKRAYQRAPSDGRVVNLWAVCVLTVVDGDTVVDTYHSGDVRDAPDSPFIAQLAGATSDHYTYGDTFHVYNGKVGIWRQAWARQTASPYHGAQVAETAWFDVDGARVTTAAALGARPETTSADSDYGIGTYVTGGQFFTRVSDTVFAEGWHGLDGKPVVGFFDSADDSVWVEQCFDTWQPATQRTSLVSAACYQREVRSEAGEVIVPHGLLIFGDPGGDYPMLATKRGATWVRVPVQNYGKAGTAYVGNPLSTRPYGQLFASDDL